MSTKYSAPIPIAPNLIVLERRIDTSTNGKLIDGDVVYHESTMMIDYYTDTALTPTEESDTTNTILTHNPAPLPWYKKQAQKTVRAEVMRRIELGFVYDSVTFSMSGNARQRWTNRKVFASSFTYPFDVEDINGDEYYTVVDSTTLEAMADEANSTRHGHRIAGTTAKESIENAANKAAVDTALNNYLNP